LSKEFKRKISLTMVAVLTVYMLLPMLAFAEGATSSGTTESVTDSVYSMSAGANHSLVLMDDGTVWSWGANYSGQLGDGTEDDSAIPVQVQGLTGIVAIDAGGNESLALKNDGTVWAWGRNGCGQLGDGTQDDSAIPVQVQGLTNVVEIASGFGFNAALKDDGTVWNWGRYNCQWIDETGENIVTPEQVDGLTNITSIQAGNTYMLVLKSDGTVWAWGRNDNSGVLGDGTTQSSLTPVQVSELTSIVSIYAGQGHNFAVKSDGSIWAWGANHDGQFGDGTTDTQLTPRQIQVQGITNIIDFAMGDSYTIFLNQDGTVWSSGEGYDGQLGDGIEESHRVSTPVQVQGLIDVTDIAAGVAHNFAIKKDGTVWSWGDNGSGQLGDGTAISQSSPVKVEGVPDLSVITNIYNYHVSGEILLNGLSKQETSVTIEKYNSNDNYFWTYVSYDSNPSYKTIYGEMGVTDSVYGSDQIHYYFDVPEGSYQVTIENGTESESFVVTTEMSENTFINNRINYYVNRLSDVSFATAVEDTSVVNIPDSNLEAAIRDELGIPDGDITTDDMANLTLLETPSHVDIEFLNGLEYATNLGVLWIDSAVVSDITVLWSLANLSDLSLRNNHIFDITSLGQLTNLRMLDLYSNQISDISVLANLPTLTYVDVRNNPLNSSAEEVIQTLLDRGVEVYYDQTVTNSVNIPDSNLEAAIRDELGIPDGDITVSDMEHLYQLHAHSYSEIQNLSGLEYAVNLGILYLEGNQISDLLPIRNLTQLRHLGIGGNSLNLLEQVDTINQLTQLESLRIRDLQIDDSTLTNFVSELTIEPTSLYLPSNQITDISSLGSLIYVESLDLSGNPINNITTLTDTLNRLSNLKNLYLGSLNIDDSTLSAFITNLDIAPQLTTLALNNNDISELSPLSNLTQLSSLYLIQNDISDITPLSNLTQLGSLHLGNNQIDDISALVTNNQNGGFQSIQRSNTMYLTHNNLDLSSGSNDLANIETLKQNGVEVFYTPQNSSSPSIISGTVTSEGYAVPGVNVVVYDSNDSVAANAITGVNGTYSIELPAGEYKVTVQVEEFNLIVSADGYVTEDHTINLGFLSEEDISFTGGDLTLDLAMIIPTITFETKNEKGEPIVGATIELINYEGETTEELTFVTGTDGIYTEQGGDRTLIFTFTLMAEEEQSTEEDHDTTPEGTTTDNVFIESISPAPGSTLQAGTTVTFTVEIAYTLESENDGFVEAELGLPSGASIGLDTINVQQGSGTVTITEEVDVDRLSDFLNTDTVYIALSLGYPIRENSSTLLYWESLSDYGYTIMKPSDAIAKPTGLNAIEGDRKVDISWETNGESNLAGYNLYQNGLKVNTSLITGTTYTVNSLMNGATYSYAISAVDTIGNESFASEAVTATPQLVDSDQTENPSTGEGSPTNPSGDSNPPPSGNIGGEVTPIQEDDDELEVNDDGVTLSDSAASLSEETTEDGKTVTKVTLEGEKLTEAFGLLKNNNQGSQTVTVEIKGDNVTKVEIPTSALAEAKKLDSRCCYFNKV
jgi:alpha-tubulin suppressor-like RCC1 family protein/Leucine-rich repeat (LRR) protein